jgi:hypothetical protein
MSIMKKIFTLIFCSIILSAAAFAQDGHREWNNRNSDYDNRDRDHNFGHDQFRGDRHRGHDEYKGVHDRDRGFFSQVSIRPTLNVYFTYQNYRYAIDQRDAVVARISAYYDGQIEQVVNDYTLSRWGKRDAINYLTAQKTAEINNIYSQCGNVGQYPGQY